MRLAGSIRPAYFLYQLFWSSVDWLFPPVCGGCRRSTVRWCEDCQRGISKIDGTVCPRCGDPMPTRNLCQDCASIQPSFEMLRSYAIFEGPLRSALHQLKYERDVGLAEPLSKHLIELYNELKWDIDIVTPIPLGARRARERGFNQSDLLARPLAYAIQKPYYPRALRRIRDTRSQVGLSAMERRNNVESGFTAQREIVRGKAVLIIDDVMTTGSTVNACAQALRMAGASAVYGLTLARAALHTHIDDPPNPSDSKRR